jgi:hypothetical protein
MGDVRWYRRFSSVSDNIDRFGFTMCDATSDDIITEQKGVIRTNCLDWYESCALLLFPVAYETDILELASTARTLCRTFYRGLA